MRHPSAGRIAPPLAFAGVLLASACAPAPTASTPDVAAFAADPNDACARQQQNFANARNLFAASVITGAAVGAVAGSAVQVRIGGFGVPGSAAMLGGLAAGALAGAAVGSYLEQRRRESGDDAALATAVAGDLARENDNLDLARNAAEFLLDCRLRRAQDIREAARAGTLPAPQAQAQLATLQAQAGRDLELAREVEARIATRDGELAPAMEALAPGARAEGAAEAVSAAPAMPATAPIALPLRARPEATAVTVATVPAGQPVLLRPAREPGFVAVEAAGGTRLGYVPAASFPAAPTARAVPPPPNAPLRVLAASNVVRRDNFRETVGDLSRAAAGQGFEPGI
jgi:hypothetical protein